MGVSFETPPDLLRFACKSTSPFRGRLALRRPAAGYIPRVSMIAIGMIATIANEVSTSVDAACVS